MVLPDRQYFSLESLSSRWNISVDDLRYYVEHAELSVCCWLDLRDIMRFVPNTKTSSIVCAYERYEGYVGVRPNDCRKVFRCKRYRLASFVDMERSGYEISIMPQNRDVIIGVDDLVIRKDERARFEKQHDIIPLECAAESKIIKFDPNRLYIDATNSEYIYQGAQVQLGIIQANIIKQLAQAKVSGTPWVHGKILLSNAGSQAVRIRDVFRSHNSWQNLVESNKRGYYRIKSEIDVAVA